MNEPIRDNNIQKALEWLGWWQREQAPTDEEARDHAVPASLDAWFSDWMEAEQAVESVGSAPPEESRAARWGAAIRFFLRRPLPLAFAMFIGLAVIVNGVYNHRPMPSAFHYEFRGTHIEVISGKTDNMNPVLVSRTVPEGFQSEITESFHHSYDEILTNSDGDTIYVMVYKPGATITLSYEGDAEIITERIGNFNVNLYTIGDVLYYYWDDGELFYAIIGNVDRAIIYDLILSLSAKAQ